MEEGGLRDVLVDCNARIRSDAMGRITVDPLHGFRRFFTQMIPARQLATLAAARMDASFPSASGARLTLLL